MGSKLGRNDPCWCGSGGKFKKCHYPEKEPQLILEAGQTPFGGGPFMQTLASEPAKNIDGMLDRIVEEQKNGTRKLPSERLLSIGSNPSLAVRNKILDECAKVVDNNWCGRSEMCLYFSIYVSDCLEKLGLSSSVRIGKASYRANDKTFDWDHAWVETISGEIIDGNADSMHENPYVPEGMNPRPYWGPKSSIPDDRVFGVAKPLSENDQAEYRTEMPGWKAMIDAIDLES